MPVVTAYDDDAAEAEGVVSLLLEHSADGIPWSEQAVLARTHDQLSVIRRALTRAGIPCRIAPGPESPTGGPRAGEVVAGTEPGRRAGRHASVDDDAVELATFHRAKGLEWTSVHVVGLEDGFVPIIYATSAEARDEERRLLYVALTRASRILHCSWARSRTMGNGRTMERQPSPWLASVARDRGQVPDGSPRGTPDGASRRSEPGSDADRGGTAPHLALEDLSDHRVDEDRRVIRRLLALPGVPVDQPVRGPIGQDLGDQDQVDAHPPVPVERSTPVV